MLSRETAKAIRVCVCVLSAGQRYFEPKLAVCHVIIYVGHALNVEELNENSI